MLKSILTAGFSLMIFVSQAPLAFADESYHACGYRLVHHDDGAWTIYKDGEVVGTYGSGYTLDDLKEHFCD